MKDTHGNRLFDDRGAAAEAGRRRPGALDGLDSEYDGMPAATQALHPATPLRLEPGVQGHIETTTQAAAGAGIGGAIGAVLGAIALAVLSVGTSIAIPGLGWVLSGAVVSALTGAGAGAVAGGLLGLLVGLAMKQERLRRVAAPMTPEPADRWHDQPRHPHEAHRGPLH